MFMTNVPARRLSLPVLCLLSLSQDRPSLLVRVCPACRSLRGLRWSCGQCRCGQPDDPIRGQLNFELPAIS
ncbi:hypothetical protein N657DRAFT_638935 [Parathielavia appendiculata]|uniref:Uncharacterized protein n=1 Tax=Parathielavia appendiculata TaxID=2587402 RepID=A0AAN6UBD9_9PEZI|nr:hypothetical protein N657DRAFT_638935 [Parathielavia appendiculata]